MPLIISSSNNMLPVVFITVGLALILMEANRLDFRRHATHLPWRSFRYILLQNRWIWIGTTLCCAGLLFGSKFWLESIVWLLALLGIGYGWWLTRQNSNVGPNFEANRNDDTHHTASANPASYLPPLLRTCGIWLERIRPLWVGLWALAFAMTEVGDYFYALGSLAILWIFTGVTTGRWGRRMPGDWCLALWLLLVPVTLQTTTIPAITRVYLSLFLAQIVVFYTVASWAYDAQRIKLLTWGLMGIGVALAILTPGSVQQKQVFIQIPPALMTPLLPWPKGINPNVMGGILAVLVPLSAGLVLAQQQKRPLYWVRLILTVAGTLTIVVGLIITQSRGAYFAAALSLLLMAILRWPQVRGIVAGGLIGLVVLGFFWHDSIRTFITAILNTDAVTGLDQRAEIWSHAFYAIRDFPLTGIGIGTFGLAIPLFYPYITLSPGTSIYHAHNLFLQVGADLGIPGLVAFIALILSIAMVGFAGWRHWQKTATSEMQGLILGSLGALCVMLIHGMVDAVTWNLNKPALLVWAALGLLSAAGQLAARQDSKDAEDLPVSMAEPLRSSDAG
ncbi:MAG: O-antigen ligase family protein [Chloroflexi bacterium]|nr:O-antigen ligase family protein [Chloroflexota bacterium]